MRASLNGDLAARVCIDTAAMEWTASPSPTVQRKRLHRVGPAEAGQVTSLVRYAPSSSFAAHDHPEGEEILVLRGTFSDEHGDWPAGSYLLNPEGFHHAPFSREGCELFVKLRQFAGSDREHHVLDTEALPWLAGETRGVEVRPLYAQAGHADRMALERWAPGSRLPAVEHDAGVEFFVLEGSFADELDVYGRGSWLRLPMGARQQAHSEAGCLLYVKRGGLPGLRAGAPA